MREQRSAKKASPKKKLAPQEDASVTESEQSEEEEDSMVHVEEPATQFVPERRNEGSLDLYSDGEDKFSQESKDGLE